MIKINKSIFNYVVFCSLIIIVYYIIYFLIPIDSFKIQPSQFRFFGIISILNLVAVLVMWEKASKSAFNLFTIFLISFVLFNLGQIILYSIGVYNYSGYNIFVHFTLEEIFKATLYTMICLNAFFIGAMFSINNKKENRNLLKNTDIKLLTLDLLGKGIFVISIGPFLFQFYRLLSRASEIGYRVYRESEISSAMANKIMGLFSSYFICALIILLVSSANSKKKFNLVSIILILHCISLFAIGERTEPTSILLFVIWLRTYYFGRNINKNAIKVVLLGLILLIIFPAIMAVRNSGMVGISDVIRIITTEGILNSLTTSIANIGYSIFPLINTMTLVPEFYSYKFGLTYISALTAVIPYLGIAKNISDLSKWLMDTLGMTYGPGFSIPAEAYINFGWVPIPIMLLLGYIIAKLLFDFFKDKTNYYMILVGSLFFILNITLPRREILGVIRDIFWFIIPIYILLLLMESRIRNRYKGREG